MWCGLVLKNLNLILRFNLGYILMTLTTPNQTRTPLSWRFEKKTQVAKKKNPKRKTEYYDKYVTQQSALRKDFYQYLGRLQYEEASPGNG